MHIVFLDQNQWVKLGRSLKSPQDDLELCELAQRMQKAVNQEKLLVPLTSANIYETSKINRLERRARHAYLLCALSKGRVFRGRQKRLEVEVSRILRDIFDMEPSIESDNWFLSDVFINAFVEYDDDRIETRVSDRVVSAISGNPTAFLFDFLANQDEETRRRSVRNYTNGSETLRERIEKRRHEHASEPLAVKKRIYSALTLIGDFQRIADIAKRIGRPIKDASDLGDKAIRRIAREVPTYDIERELAVRLEQQDRDIDANDFRDMESFCTVIPYASCVVAENMFVNLSIQSGLDKKYNTVVTTDILRLRDFL